MPSIHLRNPMNKYTPSSASKKAQLQMTESISVIIIITFIIVIGVVFYSKLKASDIQEIQQGQFALSAVQTAQRLSSLPELTCSTASVQDSSCIDLYKAQALAGQMRDSSTYAFYTSYFGDAKITLEPIFPLSPGFSSPITLYENNASNTLQSGLETHIPFAVLDPAAHTVYFAILHVTSFSATRR